MYDRSSKFQGQELKKWRLFQATDFQSLMNPCFIFCQILGIFPYKINASTFKISKPHYILSTVLTCAIGVYVFILLYKKINETIDADFDIISWIIENIFRYILSSFIMIVTHILSSPRMRLFQTIMDVSSKLSSKTYKKLSRFIHVKDIFCSFFLVIICVLYSNDVEFNLIEGLYNIYITFVILQMDMLYFNCVCILKACFKRINDNLANFWEPVVKDVLDTFSRNYKQRNAFLMMKLKALQKQHLMISNTVLILNLVFSLQLLASIIIILLQITFIVYFYASISKITDLQKNIFHFILMVYNVLKILSIIWACQTGKNQALEIGTTIHIMSNRICDADIKHELQLFSLQILHCNNVFSTKGFNVDATLLATIVGSITKYVIILMQFLFVSNSCKGSSTNNILHE